MILTDLEYNPVGEILNADDRAFNFGTVRNRLEQAQFRVRMDNPLAEQIAEAECGLMVYRGDTLKIIGPVLSAEEVGDQQSAGLAVTAASQAVEFQKRIMGQSATGTQYPLQDRALTAKQMIDAQNTVASMRIATDATSYSGSTATYQAGPYKPLSACIAELSNILDGFDWRVIPQVKDGSGNVGLWTARPTLGVARPEAIFEFGVGRNNIVGYKLQVSRDTQANVVFNPGNSGHKVQSDATSIAKWGRMEAVAELLLNDEAMRQKLVDEHVAVRKNPRRVITFTPHVDDGTGRVPVFGVDYEVGDIVVARAVRGSSVRFNGDFRVWGATVSFDKNGTETVSLTLTDDA